MTGNNNFLKNAEGYSDPTPYGAFNEIHEGEIYEYNGKEILILRAHENFCNILTLTPKDSGFDTIKVTSRSVMYTDPAMLSYVFKGNIGGFIKKLADDEFEMVLRNVEAALMLEFVKVVTKENIINVQNKTKTNSEEHPIYKQLYEELLDKVMKKAFG